MRNPEAPQAWCGKKCELDSKPEGQPVKSICKGVLGHVGKTKSGWGQTGVLTRRDLWSFIQAGYDDGHDQEDGLSGRQSQVFGFSSKSFAVSPAQPQHPAGFLNCTRKGCKSRRRWQVHLEQRPVTAIINVCTSKQLRLPQCQNKQPVTPDSATQRIITRDKISDPMKCSWQFTGMKTSQEDAATGTCFPQPDAGMRVPHDHCLVGTE